MVNVLKLAVNDLRNIIRDRMFVFLFFAYPVMLILVSRIIVHLIAPRIENMFPLAGEFSVLFMFFTIAIPMIFSFLAAFLILDERDEHLLTVLRVMPISRNNYLIYRMFFMSLFAFIVLLIFPPLSGLVDGTQFSYPAYIPVAILFALFTPFSALLVSYLKYIFSPIPNFWSIMSLDSVLQNGTLDIVHLGIGFVFHIALIGVLFYIFNKKN